MMCFWGNCLPIIADSLSLAKVNTGERVGDRKSPLDTQFCSGGVLACREYFPPRKIQRCGDEVFDRVNGHGCPRILLCCPTVDAGDVFPALSLGHSSEPDEDVSLGPRFPTYPLATKPGPAWKRLPSSTTACATLASFGSDLCSSNIRSLVDFPQARQYADLFSQFTLLQLRLHRHFCLELTTHVPRYGENLWGISASLLPRLCCLGGPQATGPIDGTIVPTRSAGSLPSCGMRSWCTAVHQDR